MTSASIGGSRFVFYDAQLYRNRPVIQLYGNIGSLAVGELTYYSELGRQGIPMYNNTTNNKKSIYCIGAIGFLYYEL
ncbi:hypothetical protein A0O00_09925 [Proteus mirabilis]|nr:hypothetical protein A0O00_09925 [Proteus mirabilis]